MTVTHTSTSLIRRLRDQDDVESWREFVTLYQPLLLSYVRSRGLGHADAADVVQEIFVALLRTLPNFELDRQRGRFRTWLYQVTVNKVADHGRRQQSRHRAEEGLRHHAVTVTPAEEEPDAEFVQAHRRRILEFVFGKVRVQVQPKTWYCFEQHVLRGRPGADLAQELGITANAVCVNAGRILDRVRTLCADYMEELDD